MTTPQNDVTGTASPAPLAAVAGAAPMNGLYCEVHWGPERTTVRSFDATVSAVRAAPDERAPVPLYGFDIPDDGWVLAERTAAGSYVIFPPPGTIAHRRHAKAPLERLIPTPGADGRLSLSLTGEERISLSLPARDLRIELFPSVVKRPVEGLPIEKRVGVILALLAAFLLPLGFIAFRPNEEEIAEKNAKTLEEYRRVQDAQRKQLEKDAKSWTDESAPPVRPEDGLTLPNSFRR